MKNKFIGSVCLCFLMSNSLLWGAQDTTLQREVKVNNEYRPIIDKERDRIDINPDISNTLDKRVGIVYSPKVQAAQLGKPGIQYLQAEDLEAEVSAYDNSFIRLGLGNYQSIRGELYLGLIETESSALSLYAYNKSTLGKVRLDNGVASKMGFHDSYGQVSYKTLIEDYTLTSQVSFRHLGFRHYGLKNDKTTPTNVSGEAQQDFSFELGLGSDRHTSIKHNTALYGKLFSYKDFAQQHRWGLKGNYDYGYTEGRALGMEVDIFTDQYEAMDWTSLMWDRYPGLRLKDTYTFETSPYYKLFSSRWALKLGAFLHLGVNETVGDGTYFTDLFAAPDVEASYRLTEDDKLSVFARVQGYTQGGDYKTGVQENLYLLPFWNVAEVHVPMDAKLGLNALIGQYCKLQLWGGYAFLEDQYLFTNQWMYGVNTFVTVTDDLERGQLGWSLSFMNENLFSLSWDFTYNQYATTAQEKAWYLPTLNTHMRITYPLSDILQVGMSYEHESGKYAGLDASLAPVKMKQYNNLSFEGEYSLTEQLKLYAEINNVLSSNYYYWDGYKGIGFHVIGGATLYF